MAAPDMRMRATVRQILTWLVEGNYGAIGRFTNGIRLSEELMRKSVTDYGRTIVMPPASVLDGFDVVEIQDSHPRAWSVRIDLWTAEEGRSDLSLECTLIDGPGDLMSVEIDNLHVL